MASTESAPINGTYGSHAYESNNYAAASSNNNSGYATSQQPPSSQPANGASTSEIPKDEVGWYFVEQYYTTLSKSPDRLYVCHPWREAVLGAIAITNWTLALLQQAFAVCVRN
jgi:hypothetical protein